MICIKLKDYILFVFLSFLILILCYKIVDTYNQHKMVEASTPNIANAKVKEEDFTLVDTNNSSIPTEVKNKPSKGVFNALILGSDERGKEKSRSDVVMIAQYNFDTNNVSLLSIPRDTKVYIDGYGYQKINAAHAFGGPELSVDIVQKLLDINIHTYASVNFYGFIEIVDSLGGVEVDVKKPITWVDNDFNKTYRLKTGTQTLKGEELLTYVRFRGDSEGDYGRVQRQQEVIESLIDNALSLKSLFKLPEICSIIKENVKTDITTEQIKSLLLYVDKLSKVTINSMTLNTYGSKENGIWYQLYNNSDLENSKNFIKK